MARQLVDPRLRTGMWDHWPHWCTIQDVVFDTTASNQEIPSGATTSIAHISCRLSALIDLRPTDNEDRTEKVQSQYERRTIKLNGYYPNIQVRTQQALVNSVVWQIRGVEHDSEHFSTRLNVERILP